MRDSDIDSLSADGAQEPNPLLSALDEHMERAGYSRRRTMTGDRFARKDQAIRRAEARAPSEAAPRTAAGRSLLQQWIGHENEPEVRIVILAIEAEAAQSADGLRAALDWDQIAHDMHRHFWPGSVAEVHKDGPDRGDCYKCVAMGDWLRAALTSASPEAEGLSAEPPATALDDLWEQLAQDIHANGNSVRDAIAKHRPRIAAAYATPDASDE